MWGYGGSPSRSASAARSRHARLREPADPKEHPEREVPQQRFSSSTIAMGMEDNGGIERQMQRRRIRPGESLDLKVSHVDSASGSGPRAGHERGLTGPR